MVDGPLARTVRISGLRCAGRHGAYAGERDVTRTFLVDVSAHGALDDADVERLASVARAAVAHGSHALLERLAAEVADAILAATPTVAEVRVRVLKPDPPDLAASSEAVSLSRSRRPLEARAPSAPPAPRRRRRARG